MEVYLYFQHIYTYFYIEMIEVESVGHPDITNV